MESLANIMWRAFSGSQAHLARGTDRIRRYAPGYSPLIGYDDPARPDFAAIAPFCDSGERFYCAEWTGAEPAGWKIEVDSSMCGMLWNGTTPAADATLDAVRLGPEHVSQMMALTALTRPGPFGDKTIELGEWHGVFDGERLIAMAGERMQVGNLREISGICTQPEYQGRGLARRMTELLVRIQLARGQVPILHVAASNARALELYKRIGFVVEREVPMRVISRA